MQMIRDLFLTFAVAFTLVATGGTVVRLTVQDQIPYLAVVYYVTPLPVIGGLFGVSIVAWLLAGYRRTSLLMLVITIVSLVWAYTTVIYHHEGEKTPEAIRVVLWNVGGHDLVLPGTLRQLRSYDADLIILNEAGRDDTSNYRRYERAFPGYGLCPLHEGLLVLARGEVEHVDAGKLIKTGRYAHRRVRMAGTEIDILQPDLKSNPLRHRGPDFERLWEVTEPLLGRPLIVAGDVNTPVDSAFVAPFREHFAEAFEAAGDGYHATWPIPVPLLAIDHAWISPELKVTHCQIDWTERSDHRPMIFEITPRPVPEKKVSGWFLKAFKNHPDTFYEFAYHIVIYTSPQSTLSP
jgi:endonuclease/exonuclease/phosphatase (EEP) superfamily protein YafD